MSDRGRALLKRTLGRAGLTGRDAREIRDWVDTRRRAATRRRPILTAAGISITETGRVELVPVEVPLAGPGEVTVRADRTAISVGTEKARYLELPHARTGYPFRPGYSGCGTVVAVGDGVDSLSVGDRVAASRLLHQSVQNVMSTFVHRIDPRVDDDAASLLELAIIAGHGVETATAGTAHGDYIVIGAGAIGALASRLLAARGFGPGTLVASSRTKEHVALAEQAFVALDEHDRVGGLEAGLVVESTSDPASLANAIRFARPGGRVVLLGSPRGTTVDVPVDHLEETGKELVGAHISLLAGDDRRRLGEEYLRLLAEGRLSASGLVTDRVDPNDAALFYRSRISDPRVVAAVFDWTVLPDIDRGAPGSLARPPQWKARGVGYDDPPAPRGSLGWPSHRVLPSDAVETARGDLGVAVVGCGEIALQNARAIQQAANCRLVRAFDPDRALAEDLTRVFGGTPASSFDELLGDDDVDAVLLCVPHHLHAPMAVDALAAGKRVVIEKPLANSLAAGRSIAGAESRAPGTGSVCFPHRFDRRVQAARELVAAGAVGEITGFAVRFFQDKRPSYWIGGYSGRSISDWRTSRERSGGGVLIMNACHYLDLLLHVAGIEISGVRASATHEGGREVEDGAHLVLDATCGAAGTVTLSSAVHGARGDELRIWGTLGHIEVFPNPRVFTLKPVGGITASRWQDLGVAQAGSYRQAYFERLATAWSDGRPAAVGIGDGLIVQAIIEAAYESSGSGIRVDPRLLSEPGTDRPLESAASAW